MATVLFVDTNFFLHLKEPAQLRWTDVSGQEELHLMVPRQVQTEIDRFKQDGNSKRSKRARKTSSFLRDVIKSPEQNLVIRKCNPRVVIGFPPVVMSGTTRPATLDPTRADDQIVGEVMDFIASHPTDQVFLLTNDTGPMLTARHHQVPFIEVPDTWLLDPAPDERDKAILDLKRRVESLERMHPIIDIFAFANGRQINDIHEDIPRFDAVPDALIDQLIEEVRTHCPVKMQFQPSATELLIRRMMELGAAEPGSLYVPPTADEIRSYREEHYPAWLAEIRKILSDALGRLNEDTRTTSLQFQIRNTGTVPANNALIEIEAHGQLKIHAPRGPTAQTDASEPLRLPPPPSPPSGHFQRRHSLFLRDRHPDVWEPAMPALERLSAVPLKRDRNAFYWEIKEVEPSKFLSRTCEEFRHQNEAETFDVEVVLPHGKPLTGAVSCKFSASNLPQPVELKIPVRTSVVKGETEEYLRSLILKLPRTRQAEKGLTIDL